MANRTGSSAALAAAAVVLTVYLFALYGRPTTVFWSPDEGAKLIQASSIRFDRGLEYALPYPGERIDPDLRFYADTSVTEGKVSLYPRRDPDGGVHWYWPTWFPFISKVSLVLFGATGLYLVPLLAGWATSLLSGRLAAVIDPRLQAPAILVVGVATPIYFYSLRFWEHTLATALGVSAVLLFVRGRGSLAALFRCLPFLLASLLLRLEMIALLLAVGAAWAACRLRPGGAASDDQTAADIRFGGWETVLRIGLALALAGAFALSLTDRHTAALVLMPRHLVRLAELPSAFTTIFIHSAADFGPAIPAETVSWAAAALLLCVVAPFVRWQKLEAGMTVIGLGSLLFFSATLLATSQPYRSLHGLLPIAPFLILAPYALPTAWRRPGSPLFALAAVAFFYVVAGTGAILVNSADAEGRISQGLEWGPRYLLTLYPILVVLGLGGLRDYWRSARPQWLREGVVVLAVGFIATGYLLERRGVREVDLTLGTLAAWQDAMAADGPIVTDIWWLPAALADFYAREEMYVVGRERDVGAWCRLAAEHGIGEFTFASQNPIRSDDFTVSGLRVVPRGDRLVRGLHLTRFELVRDS